MTVEILSFFQDHRESLPLFEAFQEKVLALDPDTTVKVSRTQISFFARRMFACVSFLPARRGKKPAAWITVTFGLDHPLDSPRIDRATEAAPRRWTHHIMISEEAQLDRELMGWIREAHDFAAAKR